MVVKRHLTFANLAAGLALVVAIGSGGAVVAAGLAKNSVGAAQIKTGAVRSPEIKNNTIKSKDVKNETLTGADVVESSLGKVPSAASVDTVQKTARVSVALGGSAIVATKGPLTLTLTCVDLGGGNTEVNLDISTSVDNAAMDANVSGTDDGDLDVADGPRNVADDSGTTQEVEHVGFAALTPAGELWQGYGMVATRFGGSTGCFAEVVYIG